MTLLSSHHPDSSSVSSTPHTGTGNGNGGTNHLHQSSLPPAPAAPPTQAAHVGLQVHLVCSFRATGSCRARGTARCQLRYVGWEIHIISFPRAAASYGILLTAPVKVAPTLFTLSVPRPSLKYQLPQDDLDFAGLRCVRRSGGYLLQRRGEVRTRRSEPST
ncbi:unnamed protein product [Urochloa humidicola]